MNTLEQIYALFGVDEGESSVWDIRPCGTAGADIWFGSEHIGLLLQTDNGDWFCTNGDFIEPDGRLSNNPLNALTDHIGGGLQNVLSNKARSAFRQVTVNYFTNAVMAKKN